MIRRLLLSAATAALFSASAPAIVPEANTFPALGSPTDPKVQIPWNRFYDVEGINMILRQIADAHPDKTKLVLLGKSFEGREIWAIELASPAGPPPLQRPAMYIDGNIHGNEAQTAEVVLYTAWYLLEMYDRVPLVKELLDTKTFYLIPTINPDGRDGWLHEAANPHLSRGGRMPVDNDQDGLFDEDGPEDLDGDGQITQMRIRDPFGRWRPDPDFPQLMVRVETDQVGTHTLLGQEGIDNDGDGDINEDGPGGYDPNRNWPYGWEPEGAQFGAHHYPFSLPETRAVAEYVRARPNIAAVQSYHNAGGMILRGPGDKDLPVEPADDRIAEFIGSRGAQMLPFYDNWVTWKDLYRVFGGEFEWFYSMVGAIGFTNEMWSEKNLYRRDLAPGLEGQKERSRFIRHLLQNEGLTEWKVFDHPTYGEIEIGGTAKNFGRVPPGFMIEEELHRNMASTLYHAWAMPNIRFGDDVDMEDLGGGITRVRLDIINDGLIPTRLAVDVKNNITMRNILTVEGAEVVASGIVTDRYNNRVTWQKIRPERLEIESIQGLDRLFVELLLKGDGPAKVRFETVKAGIIEREIGL